MQTIKRSGGSGKAPFGVITMSAGFDHGTPVCASATMIVFEVPSGIVWSLYFGTPLPYSVFSPVKTWNVVRVMSGWECQTLSYTVGRRFRKTWLLAWSQAFF